MGCLPETGGCERHRTDPFAGYLNRVEGSHFIHEACLDRLYRDTPQPEALYRDTNTDALIVIERKTLIWPLNHAASHRNYHSIAEALSDNLRSFARNLLLSIHLKLPYRISRSEIAIAAKQIADAVQRSEPAILKGEAIGIRNQPVQWSCYLDRDERFANDTPSTGLIVRWEEPDEFLPPAPLPALLVEKIQRHFRSTVAKFSSYSNARGILLFDPHASIRYADKSWWSQAFDSAPVPPAIAEVWLGTYDWITDADRGWSFERVHPM